MQVKNLAAKAAVVALTLPFTALSMAQTVTDPMEGAFEQIEAKMTAAGGFAMGLAVVGALVWSGIALFKKGTRAGGGKT